MIITEKAPAKINLGLKVIGKRDDGYHSILSIFQTVTLYDEVSVSTGDPGFYCSSQNIPLNNDNLVLKAEDAFRSHFRDIPRVYIRLEKRIPVGGGLAGGSTDAAAALRALCTFHKINPYYSVLHELASRLGSDVPFLLKGGTAVVTGRGEMVCSIPWPFDFSYVIFFPNFSVSTAWAYRNLGKLSKDYSHFNTLTKRLESGSLDAEEFLSALENDFEELVLNHFPKLSQVRASLLNYGAGKALLTGSGSSIIGIFTDHKLAVDCARKVQQENLQVFIVKAAKPCNYHFFNE